MERPRSQEFRVRSRSGYSDSQEVLTAASPTSASYESSGSQRHREPLGRMRSRGVGMGMRVPYGMDRDQYLEAIDLTDRENLNTNRLEHAAATSALLTGLALFCVRFCS